MRVLRDVASLVERGLLTETADLDQVAARYAVAVTSTMADLIDMGDAADPIARQFLPDARELAIMPEERADPIGDAAHSPCEGIVHRYPDRVLLKLVQVCAVYCRFCFRREMVGPGQGNGLTEAALDTALAYVAGHNEIWEVILTGGDPLMMSPRRLGAVSTRLADMAHVKILRVHTRIPIVDAQRIDDALIDALQASKKTVYVAVHANHPRELTQQARAACARLVARGVQLVSQTVLLRGVNNDVATLTELMRGFVEAGIKPYYLHHPDLAPGTSHFRVSLEEGQALVAALRGQISGLCQPQYVLDIPGGYGKSPVGPVYLERDRTGAAVVQDYTGGRHPYPPRA